jgi:adenylate cyclase
VAAMKYEIERRFLITDPKLFNMGAFQRPLSSFISQGYPLSTNIHQGYLTKGDGLVVRVRLERCGDNFEAAYLTIKGPKIGAKGLEYEYPISTKDAQDLLSIAQATLTKQRWELVIDERPWVIDVFVGRLDGIVIAEVELPDEKTKVEVPAWMGKEVTLDHRYSNVSLAFNGIPNNGSTEDKNLDFDPSSCPTSDISGGQCIFRRNHDGPCYVSVAMERK